MHLITSAFPQRPACQHCQQRPSTRPRGLCWTCWTDQRIRAHYGPVSIYGHRGTGQSHNASGKLPAEPTSALPGTEEKIRVLEARAAAGEALFHPDDCQLHQSATLTAEVTAKLDRGPGARRPRVGQRLGRRWFQRARTEG